MYLLGLKYLEALPLVTAGAGTTIFLPAEAAGVMGALGGIKEMLFKTPGAGAASASAPRQGYQPPSARPATARIADGSESPER
jgi:hypothetical protein